MEPQKPRGFEGSDTENLLSSRRPFDHAGLWSFRLRARSPLCLIGLRAAIYAEGRFRAHLMVRVADAAALCLRACPF
jgi:hypothetical protein